MPLSATPLTVALVIALVVVALLSWLCYRLLLDRGRLLLRLEGRETGGVSRQTKGLPAGAHLADFALPRLARTGEEGAFVTLSSLIGQPLLLTFLRADCLFSRAYARELAQQAPLPDAPLPVSIVIGELDAADTPFADLPGVVVLDPHGQVARLLRVTATPSGYRVDVERCTAGRLLTGPLALLAAARGETPPSGGGGLGGEATVEEQAVPLALSALPARASSRLTPLSPGDPAPDFTLPAIAGGTWTLGAQRGTPLLLLFSDPDCPPCAALLAELGQFASSELAIVSRGEIAENQPPAAGINAPFLLQQQREIARAYGTLETPSAFVIGTTGEIAAGPAIGKEAVLTLMATHGLMHHTPYQR